MNKNNKLYIIISIDKLTIFFQLLAQGFILESPAGCSLRDFIRDRLGLDRAFLARSVQTIFLDHHPVDNLDAARIRAGSTVALSAAMPGLAGATLRTGGRLAAMRQQISYDPAADGQFHRTVKVTVKFFNAVATEQGESRLKNGIWIRGSDFAGFLERHTPVLEGHLRSVRLDGKRIDPRRLARMPWPGELFLQVVAE